MTAVTTRRRSQLRDVQVAQGRSVVDQGDDYTTGSLFCYRGGASRLGKTRGAGGDGRQVGQILVAASRGDEWAILRVLEC